jgi:protocatechuate 3,4-dioxygenase alpha subunit
MYFADRSVENADDPLLATIDPARRETLIAKRAESANGVPEFRFDIVLQGEGETAFFEP